MGVLDSTSSEQGGQIGGSDSLANNNAYAGGPVLNLNSDFRGSGKYVTEGNKTYNLTLQSTDYGAIEGGLAVAGKAVDVASDLAYVGAEQNIRISDNLTAANQDYLNAVSDQSQLIADTNLILNERSQKSYQSALDAVEREAAANRSALVQQTRESNKQVAQMARESQLALGDAVTYFGGRLADTQDRAAQYTQSATSKALEFAADAVKGGDERLLADTTKYIIGGVVLAALSVPLMVRWAR